MSEKKGRTALVAELKALTKTYGDIDRYGVIDAMFSETDRGAVILMATALEDLIQDALELRMGHLNADEKARLFGVDAPLGTFSAKIRMAHALRIVERDEMRKIDLLREARNACAHSRGPISFETPQLKAVLHMFAENTSDHIKYAANMKVELTLATTYFGYRLKGYTRDETKRIIDASVEESRHA